MTRRTFLRCASLAGVATAAPARRPNVLLILADDLGYECLGCNGGTSYRTPHLDALAATGVRFTHAYATPLCAPTRLQLMTGQYNFRNYEAFGIMSPREKTFGHLMGGAGYRTAVAGKWQLYSYNPPDYQPEWRGKGMRPEQSGFDEHCLWHAGHTEDKGSRYADPTVVRNGELDRHNGQYGPDVFDAFLGDFMRRRHERPFFAYYPATLTHGPFEPTPNSPEWNTAERRKANPRLFRDMVEYLDQSVGRVVKSIDEAGVRDSTLILFYSDNGTPKEIESRMGNRVIRGGKGDTTDAGTHVPLIANWRGTAPAGRVCEDLIDSIDFLPTLAAASGRAVPPGFVVDGRSFLPQVRGERGHPRDWLYCRYDPRPGWDKEQFSLRTYARDRRFKLYATGELHDVPADPDEHRPLAQVSDTPERREARRALQAVLDRMRTEWRAGLASR